MGKTKKILITITFLAIFILLGTGKAKATGELYLKNLDFEAQINQDGSMDVVETWNISIEDTKGTISTL